MGLKVLVIGSGGREHAIVHALAKSPKVDKIWCAPGNAGIGENAECLPIQADNIPALLEFAKKNKIDLTMVGPEAPLVEGIVDHFRTEGLTIVGPTRSAARLEGSKSFAKEFMRKYGIPTARYEVVPNLQKGSYLLSHWKGPCVVKADGLAAGKGVKVCRDASEAKDFLFEVMEKEAFGAAGSTVVLEECLHGEEATVMAFCDGHALVPMPASQDHKRLLDDDEGPNTGGMGAYAPAPVLTPALAARVEQEIFKPFMKGITAEGFDFRGIIYFGLMITPSGPQVLEFNTRFGDPETQVVLPLLESDLAEILNDIAEKQLDASKVRWKNKFSMCVVLASKGYPGTYEKGKAIHGLAAKRDPSVNVFHAGTQRQSKNITTSGGRVLGVTAIADTLETARDKAYQAIDGISYEGKIYRKDIGAKAFVAGLSGKKIMNRTTETASAGRLVLNEAKIAQKVSELVEAIRKEFSKDLHKLALVGIQTRGAHLVRRMAREFKEVTGQEIPVGILDITLYRDDVHDIADQPEVKETDLSFDIDGRPLVLVDDVLFTGRTVRSAMNALIDYGRPECIRLAVLVDRGHQELPINADYVGLELKTELDDVVDVNLKEIDEEDSIRLRKYEEPKSR